MSRSANQAQVVEFNASFNAQNSVPWIESPTTARWLASTLHPPRLSCATQDRRRADYRVFNDGQEMTRFQANIMMTMEATVDEVQEAIDELMSDLNKKGGRSPSHCSEVPQQLSLCNPPKIITLHKPHS